jgi:hypothetical protein
VRLLLNIIVITTTAVVVVDVVVAALRSFGDNAVGAGGAGRRARYLLGLGAAAGSLTQPQQLVQRFVRAGKRRRSRRCRR